MFVFLGPYRGEGAKFISHPPPFTRTVLISQSNIPAKPTANLIDRASSGYKELQKLENLKNFKFLGILVDWWRISLRNSEYPYSLDITDLHKHNRWSAASKEFQKFQWMKCLILVSSRNFSVIKYRILVRILEFLISKHTTNLFDGAPNLKNFRDSVI